MVSEKIYIRLRGLGGCFKTTLVGMTDYIYLPGTTRTCHHIVSDLKGSTSNVALESIISKYCQDKTALERMNGIFITERSLMDYMFLNNKCTSGPYFNVFQIAKYEVELEKLTTKTIDYVIKLSDEKFIKDLMSRNDIRSKFYGNSVKKYMEIQDKYIDFVGGIVDFDIKEVTPSVNQEMYDRLNIKLQRS